MIAKRIRFKSFAIISLIFVACSCNKNKTVNVNISNGSISLQTRINESLQSLEEFRNDTTELQIQLEKYTAANDTIHKIAIYRKLGKIHLDNNHYASAIENHQKLLELSRHVKDTLCIINAMNLLATDYREINMMDESVRFYFSALKILDNINHPDKSIIDEKISTHIGISNIYIFLGYIDEAIKTLKITKRLAKSIEDKKVKAEIAMLRGKAFQEKKLYDSAHYYYNKSLDLNINLNSRSGMGVSFLNFGNLSITRGNYPEGIIYLNNALQTLENTSDYKNLMLVYLALGEAYKRQNNFSLAEKNMLEGLKIAQKIDITYYLEKAHYQLSELYKSQKNSKLASIHYEQSRKFGDQMNKNKILTNLFNTKMEYESIKAEREIEELRLQFLEKSHIQKIIIVAAFTIILLLIVIFFIYTRYLEMRKIKNRSLIQAAKLKSEFYEQISYEFKTPVTIIRGLADKLKKTVELGENIHNFIDLDIIESQSRRLIFLLDDITTVSKLEKKNKLDWSNGNIVNYLQYLHSCFTDYAEMRKLTFLFLASNDEIKMDFLKEHLRMVVSNLINYSFKQASQGDKVLLMVRENSIQQNCIIEIVCNSESIQAIEDSDIFDESYLINENMNYQHRIKEGLQFTRYLVKNMNGELKFNSIPQKHATFAIELPIKNNYHDKNNQPDEDITPKDVNSENNFFPDHQSTEDSNKTKILIAEDNHYMRFYLSSILHDEYNIITANDGKHALELAQNHIPDLIITDLVMPKLDGNKLSEMLKNSLVTSQIPIIMITAKNDDEDRIKSIRAGVDAFIVKPFIEEELKAKIKQLLFSRQINLSYTNTPIFIDNKANNEDSAKDENLEFLQKVTDIIYREINNNDFFPQGLAIELNISPAHLNRKIKSATGLNTTNYILMVRLNKAKKMLVTSQKPIGDIAMDCGFSDFAYFSRTFKKEFGITASKYQRLSLNEENTTTNQQVSKK